MSQREREAILARRHLLHLPLHAPPHFPDGRQTYLLTATCYEHRAFMTDENRRTDFSFALLTTLREKAEADIRAWVILPNHYHVLLSVDLLRIVRPLRLLHSAMSSRWNKEDHTPGRKVWFRYADRRIRSTAHFWASFNYVHANTAKHGLVAKANDWPHSSLHDHLETHGRERLAQLWTQYPVLDYGKGWDD